MHNKIVESIVKHEGYEPQVYKCTQNFDTIGYGFAIKDLKLSKEVCDLILKEKIDKIINRLQSNLAYFDHLPDEAKVVLVNMAYQLGVSGLLKFKKTLKAFEMRMWSDASKEMLDSLWARQTPNRANELSDIIKNIGL